MTEQQFRTNLADLGKRISAHAADESRDPETMILQSEQCLRLMLAEYRHIIRHNKKTVQSVST